MAEITGMETVFPDFLLAKNQEATGQNLKLFNAVVAGSAAGVEGALEKGAKPDYFHRPEDNMNALHMACQEGFKEIVDMLLQAGAVVDAVAITTKSTPLIFAAGGGHTDIVTTLLEKGASVHAVNMYGNSPLHEAARMSVETCKVLLEKSADAHAVNNKGSTPLHFACYEDEDMSIVSAFVELFVAAGADVNAADNKGATPLLVLATTGNLDAIKLLISKGGDVTAKDVQGRDMKAIAAFYNHQNLVAFLEPKVENTKPVASNRAQQGASSAKASGSSKGREQTLSSLPTRGSARGGTSVSTGRARAASPRASRSAPSAERPAKSTTGRTGKAPAAGGDGTASSASTKKPLR
jgi:ankyrin repeat protein